MTLILVNWSQIMTKNKYLAAVLNFFLLGPGYIYNGKRTITGIFLTLGIKLSATSSIDNFPKNLTSDKWESIKPDNNKYQGVIEQGKRYQRIISNNNLTVEVYYIPNTIHGKGEIIRKLYDVGIDAIIAEPYPSRVSSDGWRNVGDTGFLIPLPQPGNKN